MTDDWASFRWENFLRLGGDGSLVSSRHLAKSLEFFVLVLHVMKRKVVILLLYFSSVVQFKTVSDSLLYLGHFEKNNF